MRPLAVALAGLVAGTLAAVQPAAAQEEPGREEARALFEEGVALMLNENWEVALAQLGRSFELYPTRSALFNIGMCEKALHRYLDALRHFEEWQQRFESAAPEEERASVRGAMEELWQFLGTLTVSVDPPDATVRLDGEPVGVGPAVGPLTVDAARHTVSASLDGYVAIEQSVLVTPRGNVGLALVLRPAAVTEAPPGPGATEGLPVGVAAAAAEAGEGGIPQAWFWTTAAVAVAAAIGGGVAGGLMRSTEEDLDALAGRCQAGELAACDEGLAKADDFDRAQIAMDALLLGGGALAATALVLAFFTDFGGTEETPPVQIAATTAGASLGLRLTF